MKEKTGWKAIEERMKKGDDVTRLSQKDAVAYLKNL